VLALLQMNEWSPYAVGVGIGLLSCCAFLLSDRPIGCSTAYARTSGMLEQLFRGRKVREMDYYRQFVPEIDWEWMLVLGVFLGALTSAGLSGELRFEWIPSVWADTFGPDHLPRLLTAFTGGVIMGLGARWAGGCTSGHGISGTLQLAVSGWLAVAAFFFSGGIFAYLIFTLGG